MPALAELLKTIAERMSVATGAGRNLSSATLRRECHYLAREALADFAARRQWMIAETQQAIAEADDGDFLNDEMYDIFLQELEAP
jgi:hypothetical protein